MLRYSRESFFYQQRKRSTSTRREKKEVDTQPVFIESILTFRPGAGGEEGLGNIRLRAKSAAAHRQRRPPSAASRKSSVWFPPIDPSGPHLTTTQVRFDMFPVRYIRTRNCNSDHLHVSSYSYNKIGEKLS